MTRQKWNAGLTGSALNIARTKNSPLRVLAGPGTGKSFALKRRVARLLEEGTAPKKILAVTFTRTAASSLVADLTNLGVPGCGEIHAGTLHSFCFSLLSKRYVFDFLNRIARPLIHFNKSGVMQYEGAPLLQDLIMLNKGFGGKRDCSKRIRAFEAAWARLQTEDPGWALTKIDQTFQDELINWLVFHEALLIGELIPLALRYLRENPASKERRRYEHVLVDEYQDLNKAEQVLIDLLCENCDTSLVGDADQSIYSFRHAHPEGIVAFSETHPHTHDEELNQCRRCPTLVVDLADHLIRKNYPSNEDRRLNPFPENPVGDVHIIQWGSLEQEAQGISNFIKHLVSEKDYKAGDVLVLTPRRLIGYGIRDALLANEIPAHSFYHEEALDSIEAQEKFALLTLLCNQSDRVALRFWLGCGSPSWNAGTYKQVRELCEAKGITLWNALTQMVDGSIDIHRSSALKKRFSALIHELKNLQGLNGFSLMDALFPVSAEWSRAIREATSMSITESTEPSVLFDALQAQITQPEMPESGEFVRIMSLHKSKGLTSKVVIMAGCLEGLVPVFDDSLTPDESKASIEEQRRLFYVAITRCREILALSSVTTLEKKLAYKIGAQVRGGGSYGQTISTRFIHELGPKAPSPKDGKSWMARGF